MSCHEIIQEDQEQFLVSENTGGVWIKDLSDKRFLGERNSGY